MADAMVTARMSAEKKAQGNRVLKREDLSASQCINMLYDRLIEEGDAAFLTGTRRTEDQSEWQRAASFVDTLSQPLETRFDSMSKAEIRVDRLKSRGLM